MSKLMGVESNTMVGAEVVVLKLLKKGSPKSGTSNVMSILVSLGVSLVMAKEVSGKALANDASNAVKSKRGKGQ